MGSMIVVFLSATLESVLFHALDFPDMVSAIGISDDVVVRPFRAEDLPQVLEVFQAGMHSYAAFQAMPE